MPKSVRKQKAKQKSDVRSGISIAVTFFIISIFLYFQPLYFGNATKVISVILVVLGVMLFGVQLNNITSRDIEIANQEKGRGIFDKIGVGLGFFIVWAVLYRYYPLVWVNALISLLLLVGLFGINLGLVSLLFLRKPTSNPNNLDGKNPWSFSVKIVTAISGIIGFIASLMQILQFFKVIP